MQYLDRQKAKKILKEELKKRAKVVEARLTLHGDEFWNSELIYADGKFTTQKDFKCYMGSFWATPCLRVLYKDGKEKHFPCYFTKEQDPKRVKQVEKEVAIMRKQTTKELDRLLKKMQKKKALAIKRGR